MKKKKIIIGVVIMMGMALMPIPSKAVLQANPNTNGTNGKSDSVENWMTNIRKMETKNQAMGLEETIDNTTKKSASGSNGIDVHMIKSTEWGTVAILSVSGYGNSKKMNESPIKSTTGNKSGVYFPLTSYEITAGGIKQIISSGIDKKYYDVYESSDNVKIGDALGTDKTKNPGCRYWHGGGMRWCNQNYPCIQRGNSTSLFHIEDGGNGISRAVVVCGEGF